MLLMEQATRLAIRKAHEHGMAIVAAHGSGSGTGAIGYFGREIAASGLIGIVLSQSPELVAPLGSYEPIFGTNPFSIGIPTQVGKQQQQSAIS
jgi:LDH2 family malate/lactate/ureidoglycolate dehydrogenase